MAHPEGDKLMQLLQELNEKEMEAEMIKREIEDIVVTYEAYQCFIKEIKSVDFDGMMNFYLGRGRKR